MGKGGTGSPAGEMVICFALSRKFKSIALVGNHSRFLEFHGRCVLLCKDGLGRYIVGKYLRYVDLQQNGRVKCVGM